MNSPIIRDPRPDEAMTVAKLYRVAQADNPHGADASTVYRRVADGNADAVSQLPIVENLRYHSRIRVADLNDTVIGFYLTASPLEWFKRQLMTGQLSGTGPYLSALIEIQLVAVFEEYRARGVGSALVADAERVVTESGARAVFVTTWSSNPYITGWWGKHGYAMTDAGQRLRLQPHATTTEERAYEVVSFDQHLGVKTIADDCHIVLAPPADPVVVNVLG